MNAKLRQSSILLQRVNKSNIFVILVIFFSEFSHTD